MRRGKESRNKPKFFSAQLRVNAIPITFTKVSHPNDHNVKHLWWGHLSTPQMCNSMVMMGVLLVGAGARTEVSAPVSWRPNTNFENLALVNQRPNTNFENLALVNRRPDMNFKNVAPVSQRPDMYF